MEKRRGPGRPAYDSKQRLVAAACTLLAERGFEASSPQMFQQRSGVGHGSMYHHHLGKEDLALDAISHMRASTLAFLEGRPPTDSADPETVRAGIVAALDRLFARKEGQALIRLLADPVAGSIKPLATATQDWCDDIRAAIVLMLRADQPGDDPEAAEGAARLLAPEFDAYADDLLTAALGRGLVGLPRIGLLS
ncbi:MAG: TetR/AcrR family transcriptional regulator [Microbacterium sp.]